MLKVKVHEPAAINKPRDETEYRSTHYIKDPARQHRCDIATIGGLSIERHVSRIFARHGGCNRWLLGDDSTGWIIAAGEERELARYRYPDFREIWIRIPPRSGHGVLLWPVRVAASSVTPLVPLCDCARWSA